LNDDCYDAALGLFLLIREEFGRDNIRRIVQGMYQQDYLNGRDLIRLANVTIWRKDAGQISLKLALDKG
jgi:hypothetical protein